ncbi:hypothetical protein V1389_03785 [Flavobacterium rakeshii]|uniref:hypothetical protein n=1 Tax=Flavobacterium rakeshii TaxID=1038845 RepID=UPI002E7C1670|nr:hypothetical protein [Flavobacterium rakeshii]MEE1897443.1 hypothetical protein [Flavobacterium rakeshii]
MEDQYKMSLSAKLLLCFGILSICVGALKLTGFISNSNNKKESEKINISNISEVQKAIQGKWNESLPSSVRSESLYFRLLIEGNKVSIWEKVGFNEWDMGKPDEVHTIFIGNITKNVDGIPCRYLYWNDDETMLTRSIGVLHITDCCILFKGSVRPLNKGWD